MGVYSVASYLFFIDLTIDFGIIVITYAFTLGYMLEFVATRLNQLKPKATEPTVMERFQRAYGDQIYRREHLMVRWETRFFESYNATIGCAEGFTVVLEYQRSEDLDALQEFIQNKRLAGWIVLDLNDFGGAYKKYRFTCPLQATQKQPEPPISKNETM